MRSQKGRRIIMGCLSLIAAATFPMAQKRPPQDSGKVQTGKQEAPFAFRVPVDVVVVNATVLDKQGNPVTDLTADDFRVYDDGKLQTIHTFSMESYKATMDTPRQETATETRPPAAKPPGDVPAARPPAPAGRARYFCFFLDDLIQPTIDLYHPAAEAIRTFISEDLHPGDQVALMAASGLASYPFTGDLGTLLSRVTELEKKLNRRPLSLPTCPQLTDMQALRIANQIIRPEAPEYSDDESVRVAVVEMLVCDPGVVAVYAARGRAAAVTEAKTMLPRIALQYVQEREYRIGLLLTSLRQFIASLRFYEGNKSLTLLSVGFYSPEVQYSLQEVIDKALRSGVTVNTLDLRGVYTTNITASDSAMVDNSTLAQRESLHRASLKAQEEPLAQLAEDTGGYFAHGNNDLHLGLKKITGRQTYNYVLSYALPNLKNDGRYHKIKLEVARAGVQVSYRQGYFAPKEEVSFVRRKREDILEALHAPGDINSIPVRLSYSFFQQDSAHYQLSVQVHVDIHTIKFADQEGRHCNLIHIVTVASDEQGRVVDGLEKAVDFKLSDASYRSMLENGLISEAEINLPPGHFKLQAVVRESVQGKMGSQSRSIGVP